MSGLAVVNGIGHVNNVKPRRARLVLGFWHVYHSTVFQATQRGNISVGRHSEYWKWFRPTLGKKRRVVHSSRPCCQDSWHAGTSLIWSNARRITGQMGWAPSRPDLSVYEWIFLALYQVKQWDKIETCVTEARQPLALMEDICCLKMTLTTTQPIVLHLELYALLHLELKMMLLLTEIEHFNSAQILSFAQIQFELHIFHCKSLNLFF